MQDAENKVNNDSLESMGDSNSRVYELGYLLVPTIAGEDVPMMHGNMKEFVSSFKGELIADEMPKMINLAYTMRKVVSNVSSKFNTAYFGWIKFTMDTDKILELKKKLDLDPNVIRFLILKTVKENTIAQRRFVRGDMAHRKPPARKADDAPALPINKEEIDKEIDALVAN